MIPAFGAIDSRLIVGLALCICGTLGKSIGTLVKATLRTYPFFRVPTMCKLSTTPIGAYNQALTFPKGKSASFFQFDPKIFNENSWTMLKGLLTKVGCVSGCRLVVSHSASRKLVIVWLHTHSAAHMELYIEI